MTPSANQVTPVWEPLGNPVGRNYLHVLIHTWAQCSAVLIIREGFCTALALLCCTVALGHSNTQLCLQSAGCSHVKAPCYWRCLWRWWTCSLVNLYNMCFHRHRCIQSTPELSLQDGGSSVYSSCCQSGNTQRLYRRWSETLLVL